MGLASYGNVNEEWLPYFVEFYKSNPDGGYAVGDYPEGTYNFEPKIDSNYSRFLSLTVPMFNILMYRDTPGEYDNDKQFYSIAPQGLSTNLYDNKDELFPIMYFKFSATPGSNLASMPNVYKGTSSLFKMESVNRYEFDTLTTDTTRDKIVCGTARTVVIPWNGAIFNAV